MDVLAVLATTGRYRAGKSDPITTAGFHSRSPGRRCQIYFLYPILFLERYRARQVKRSTRSESSSYADRVAFLVRNLDMQSPKNKEARKASV
jgi:hypothetical protein